MPLTPPPTPAVVAPLMTPARLTGLQGWRYRFLKLQARVLLTAGRQAAALPVFALMLQLQPASRYALASQGHVQMQLQQYDAAMATLQQLTAVSGSAAEQAAAWFNLGYARQQAGHTDAAAGAFEKALAFDARLDRAWYGLGLARMAQLQFTAAAEAFQQNTCLQPLSPHGWYRLVQAWLALGETGKAVRVLAHLRGFEPRVAAQLERENSALRQAEGHAFDPPVNSGGTPLNPVHDSLEVLYAAR